MRVIITETMDPETGDLDVTYVSDPPDLSKVEALGMIAFASDIILHGGDYDVDLEDEESDEEPV